MGTSDGKTVGQKSGTTVPLRSFPTVSATAPNELYPKLVVVSDSKRPDISSPIQSIKMYSCIQCAM